MCAYETRVLDQLNLWATLQRRYSSFSNYTLSKIERRMALGQAQVPGLDKSHRQIFPHFFSNKFIGPKVILMPYIASKPTILHLNFINIGTLFPMGDIPNPRPFIRCAAETSKNITGAITVNSLRNTVLTLSLKLVSIPLALLQSLC